MMRSHLSRVIAALRPGQVRRPPPAPRRFGIIEAMDSDGMLANAFEARHRSYQDSVRNAFEGRTIAFVSFAEGRDAGGADFRSAQTRMNVTALTAGFNTISSWNMKRLSGTDFARRNREVLAAPRGAGYWLWKPYIIDRQLAAMDDGDFVFYADVGQQTGSAFREPIFPLVALTSETPGRVFAMLMKRHLQRHWTKRDCFLAMDCDSPQYWDQPQIGATYLGFVASPATRRLVGQWLHHAQIDNNITDGANVRGLANLDGFQDHRHDQSILTNCIVKEGISVPDIHGFYSAADELDKNFNTPLRWIAIDRCLPARPHENVATGKPCRQSSLGKCSAPDGADAAVGGERGSFLSFHTGEEERPWWCIDLAIVTCIAEIVVFNRTDACDSRARSLQVLVSADGLQWACVFDGLRCGWTTTDPLVLELAARPVRFVQLQLQERAVLHLNRVEVYRAASPGAAWTFSDSGRTALQARAAAASGPSRRAARD
jgi:hypothetical protein